MQAFHLDIIPSKRNRELEVLKPRIHSHLKSIKSPFPSDSIQITPPYTLIKELAESVLTEEPRATIACSIR